MHLFSVHSTEWGSNRNEFLYEAKGQRSIWQGRKEDNAINLMEEGDQRTDEQYKCFCQLGEEEMTVFSMPEFRRKLT